MPLEHQIDPGWSGPGRLALKDEDVVSREGGECSRGSHCQRKGLYPKTQGPSQSAGDHMRSSGKYPGDVSITMALNYAGGGGSVE